MIFMVQDEHTQTHVRIHTVTRDPDLHLSKLTVSNQESGRLTAKKTLSMLQRVVIIKY